MTVRFRDRKTGEEYSLEPFEDGYRMEIAFHSLDDWERFYPVARGARLRKLSSDKPSLKSFDDLERI
ncbi:MAG: hypothetical protein JXQ85_13000 [Cognatishimia sp.]|uniref:hypothetical protein n=1 Tax=Cognatishimia sp. TaxID=2211648 RepID=UPI003B8CD19E